MEACTVTALDAITAFAVPNPNCSSQESVGFFGASDQSLATSSRGLPAQYFLQLLLQHDLGSAAANVALSPAPSQKGCGCTADRHIENSRRESSWR